MQWRLLYWARWVAAGLLVLAVFQGFVLSDFKFGREINIVDVATGFLTLFLALYIPSRLERRLSSQRYEKEVLIRQVERIQADFTTAWEIVQTNPRPILPEQERTIVSAFNNSGNGLNMLVELCRECNLTQLSPELTALGSSRIQFKRLITGGEFQQTSNFFYAPEVIATINQHYFRINLACSKLIIKINRSNPIDPED